MKIVLITAVEAEEFDFSQYLLNIFLQNSKYFQPLAHLSFLPIFVVRVTDY
jgi:hypothetical protein